MGEHLQGEARARMQVVLQERLRAMSDVPICHCKCEVAQHEIDAELVAGEVVILVQGHPDSETWRCACPGYEPAKEGFDRVLQNVTRGVQGTIKGLFNG